MVDGRGPLPDSNLELLALVGVGLAVVSAFTFFSGLDSQVDFVVSAPSDYFLAAASGSGDAVYFERSQIDLMNSASKNALGSDSIGSERAFCGGLRNRRVSQFRLADIIKSSSRDSIRFACGNPFEISVHTHPSGDAELSREDKQISVPSLEVTCIQYAEISVSPVTKRLHGIKCFNVENGFTEIPVYLQN